jgi:hypothetical protein
VIEDCDGDCSQASQRNLELLESPGDRLEIEIPHFQPVHSRWQRPGLILADHLDPHLPNRFQVVVERTSCVRSSVKRQPSPDVIFCRPCARPASHRYSRQQDGLTFAGGFLNLAAHDHGRRRDHHFQPVFNIQLRIIQEDVLCTGTYVYRQDLHISTTSI